MNNAINEIKNTLEGTMSRITETEDRISEIEDKMVEINEAERKKGKRIKRNEDNLRDLWDNVKRPNIWIIGVPEEEDKKKGHEKILEEIIAENFLKMGKEIATQVQETQRVPNRINPRWNTPRHIFLWIFNQTLLLLGDWLWSAMTREGITLILSTSVREHNRNI